MNGACRVSYRPARGRRLLVALTAAVLMAGVSGCAANEPAVKVSAPSPSTYRGTELDPATPKPDFTLTDTSGAPYSLRTATKGRLAYLFFGYSKCPDVCPTTMADIAAALGKVRPTDRAKTTVVFITTDPRRDTGPVLRAWLDRFDPSFVGLTGTDAQLAAAQQAAGVPLAEPEGTGEGYTVTHSAEVLAFSPDDRAHAVYLDGTSVSDYAHDLPLLLAKT